MTPPSNFFFGLPFQYQSMSTIDQFLSDEKEISPIQLSEMRNGVSMLQKQFQMPQINTTQEDSKPSPCRPQRNLAKYDFLLPLTFKQADQIPDYPTIPQTPTLSVQTLFRNYMNMHSRISSVSTSQFIGIPHFEKKIEEPPTTTKPEQKKNVDEELTSLPEPTPRIYFIPVEPSSGSTPLIPVVFQRNFNPTNLLLPIHRNPHP